MVYDYIKELYMHYGAVVLPSAFHSLTVTEIDNFFGIDKRIRIRKRVRKFLNKVDKD